jgi:hypothetical protein
MDAEIGNSKDVRDGSRESHDLIEFAWCDQRCAVR